MSKCKVPNCHSKVLAKNMCNKHYQRNAKYGDPLGKPDRPTLADRFWSKVNKTDYCWEWTASKSSHGYGQIRVGGRGGTNKGAHRVAYELLRGLIPEGMSLDHLCHNRGCVNPDHLRVVTHKQNMENIRGPHIDNSTGFRNVVPRQGKYRAVVHHDGRNHFAGSWDTPEEAHEAATELRKKLHTPIPSIRKKAA